VEQIVLGLDISTKTVGWSLIHPASFLPTLGYIALGDYKNLYQKASEFKRQIEKIIIENNVTHIAIEEDLKKFTRGKSSATTIQILSKFNGMSSYIVYDIMGKAPIHINVTDARKLAKCKIIRQKTKKDKKVKQQVFEQITEKLNEYPWPKKKMKSGPRKGEEVMIDECYDMVDAYVISIAGKILVTKIEES
jgi:hypothetical protein